MITAIKKRDYSDYSRKGIVAFLLFSLFIAGVISLFASSFPDGLERVAIDKQFSSQEAEPVFRAPFADYRIAAVTPPKVSASGAAILGTLLVFALTSLLALRLKARNG